MAIIDTTPDTHHADVCRVYQLRPAPGAPLPRQIAHAMLLVEITAAAVENADAAHRREHELVARSTLERYERLTLDADVIDCLEAGELVAAWRQP